MPRFQLSLLTALVVGLSLVASNAQAIKPYPNKRFGIGVMVGEPSAITGKYWVNRTQAIDFHLGARRAFSSSRFAPTLYADYLFHFDVGVKPPVFNLGLYLGPGLMFGSLGGRCYRGRFDSYCRSGNAFLGARMPLGVAFLFKKFSGEAFIETAADVILVPFVGFDLDLSLGFRFYI